jgi:hypothetical protein
MADVVNLIIAEKHLLTGGSAHVKACINFLDEISFMVDQSKMPQYNNYMSAAKRFLPLCSDFLDVVQKNKDFVVFKTLTEFMFKYPKSKQNLANPKELTSAVINYYLRNKKRSKDYDLKKDKVLMFMRDNTNNIYNTLVVYTNVIRTVSLHKRR